MVLEASQDSSSSSSFPLSMDSEQSEPWLLISNGDNLQNHSFYSISKNKLIKKKVSDFRNKQISSTPYKGWVVLVDSEGSQVDCCVLNITTGEKIQLPSVYMEQESSQCYECFLSKTPADPDCHILLLPVGQHPILYCRLGHENFLKGSIDFDASANLDGKIYACLSERIVEVDFVEGSIAINEMVNIAGQPLTIPFQSPTGFYRICMVNCGGDLLVVYVVFYWYSEEVAYFKIFKINVVDREISELKSIGDHVIFIGLRGNISILCGAEESSLKRNSIYYICCDDLLYVYDIEDRSKTPLNLGPIKRSTKCMTSWIMM